MKKEFLSPKAKEYNEKSDTELIDLIATDQSLINQETAKAILDKRTKKVIQHLTGVIEKSSGATERYNARLIQLTKVITGLTFLMLIGLGFQIVLFLRFQLPLVRLEAQQKIQEVVERCKIDLANKWVDEAGEVHDCSEIPEEWLQKNKI